MQIQTLAVGPLMTNCYLLQDETAGVCAVIDPGDEGARIARAVADSGCALQFILLTHGHYDHFTGLAELLRQYPDTPVYIQPNDAADGAGGAYSLKAPRLDDAHQRWYREGDTLTLGSLTIQVLETPGHSPGSVTLKVGDVLFTGDTLFCGSMGRTDFAGGSYEQIMASLKRLGQLEGDFHVCPGHDRTSTLARERQYNPFLREAMAH